MKKRLNTEAIANELKGGSAFFPDYKPKVSPASSQPVTPAAEQSTSTSPAAPESAPIKPAKDGEPDSGIMTPRHHDTMTPRYHTTTTPQSEISGLPMSEEALFEVVRKSVKKIGKEAATHRFTLDEKHHLADIEYTYKRRGIKTTENELTRIAINYFIEDYRINGERSLLAKLLEKINS